MSVSLSDTTVYPAVPLSPLHNCSLCSYFHSYSYSQNHLWIDTYLHGALHTIFYSWMDFIEHAIWLMRRKVGQYLCKYCTPRQDKLDINASSRR